MDNQNQYNFIMNPGTGATSGPAFLQDPKKRMMIVVLFVAVVLIFVSIIIGIILSLGKSDSSGMKTVAAYQNEILRVSELGLLSSKNLDTRAKISTVQSFIGSDFSKTATYMGEALSKDDLVLYLDGETDAALELAKSSNTFETVIIEKIDALFAAYQAELASAYEGSSIEEEKAILDTANQNIIIYSGL